MNKQEIYDFLNQRNIWHEITEHKAVYNMAEVAENEFDSRSCYAIRFTK